MNYGRIVEDSFKNAWKYKSLWIFGLFAGHAMGFNLETGTEDFGQDIVANVDSLEQFLKYVAPFILAFAILGLLVLILRMICSPALIDAVNRIARGGTYKFSDSYSKGLDCFFRIFGLTILTILSAIVLFGISFLPVLLMHLFGLLLTIPIFLIGLFFVIVLFGTAERVVVVRDNSIGDSLEEAWFLLKTNLGKFALMALISFGLMMGFGIVIGMAALLFYLPVNVLVGGITENLSALIILGFVFGLPISLVIGGFTGTFFHSMYTLFYFGLVDPSTPYAAVRPSSVPPQQTA